ncbi:hypothetical protein [Laribacter hongkongensis]|uniref:hypothetical protein n=1 Tax=Laribacter hongkongensis TaxID=168471 RepID=UPI0011C84982|nr:hypothetical protein [Laribacter hongkongensis]MCG9060189.1 hypothetical protein [Laribacter hongkongensis]MCG9087298.1 hypothetical protein [Laribacter hongkongensis]MCG9088062.1 hypothetical protein [Laribacter hongkongensis]MCG9110369.1 hypothetical protein [Laribacter hongkongensis]MCG9121504.1 hypothetical protein [Laribacter hongkongensis]
MRTNWSLIREILLDVKSNGIKRYSTDNDMEKLIRLFPELDGTEIYRHTQYACGMGFIAVVDFKTDRIDCRFDHVDHIFKNNGQNKMFYKVKNRYVLTELGINFLGFIYNIDQWHNQKSNLEAEIPSLHNSSALLNAKLALEIVSR